jgi:hypothetical protein
MNVDNIKKVLAWLEHPEPTQPRFDMTYFYDEDSCGTVCCIGGYAALLSGNIDDEQLYSGISAEYLGLDTHTARQLVYARGARGAHHLDSITREWAAACVRNLLETGEVDWSGTEPAEEEPTHGA